MLADTHSFARKEMFASEGNSTTVEAQHTLSDAKRRLCFRFPPTLMSDSSFHRTSHKQRWVTVAGNNNALRKL